MKCPICSASLFPLPQLRRVQPAYCPVISHTPWQEACWGVIARICSPSPPYLMSSLPPVTASRTKADRHRVFVHSLCAQMCMFIHTSTHMHEWPHKHAPKWWHKHKSPCLGQQHVRLQGGRSCRAPRVQSRNSAPWSNGSQPLPWAQIIILDITFWEQVQKQMAQTNTGELKFELHRKEDLSECNEIKKNN